MGVHGERMRIREGWNVFTRGFVYMDGVECAHREREVVCKRKGWSMRAWGEDVCI